MYVFAVVALMGLAVAAAGWLVNRRTRMTALWPMLMLGMGIGAAWLANFNVWTAWHQELRWQWVGVTFTGVILAGVAQLWHVVVRLLEGIQRKTNDEAESIEAEQRLRRVA
jgi:hypothetical protein